MCGSFLLNFFYLGGYLACLLLRSGPPVDGPKDSWPRVLSLPERFVGDPASLARDNMLRIIRPHKGAFLVLRRFCVPVVVIMH